MPESTPISIARLLSLLSWIGENPGAGVNEAARHFGRSTRQLRRDVEYLGEVGDSLPGRSFEVDWDLYEREQRLSVRTTLGADLPPRLTEAEATAILVGLQAIADGLDDALRERIPRIALTVAALAPSSAPGALLPSRPRSRTAAVDPLLDAVATRAVVEFDYASPRGTTHRVVEPHEVRRGASGWLLDGWCRAAEAPRRFRIDRISGLTRTGEIAPIRPVVAEEPADVRRIRVSSGGRWLVDEFGARVLSESPDGGLDLEIAVWDEHWFDSLLIDLAPILLDAPESALRRAGARARAALAVWTDPEWTKERER
ncbi:WYL domain-containing protein [Actinomyces sp. B33]|uniref:helix-turn-helix transcriptional regulator n=1 Tax=Actinomyces sp. B33 TaxID=2942131 RepID=UPI00233FA3E2|nr:WYL domain-containing protein [Actinomyces sp. B33]MDC4233312.1 WYL domain-containing protein [Actinomyces sp. B33]